MKGLNGDGWLLTRYKLPVAVVLDAEETIHSGGRTEKWERFRKHPRVNITALRTGLAEYQWPGLSNTLHIGLSLLN